MKRLDCSLFHSLAQRARENPRKQHIDEFHSSTDGTIRRLLHALEPDGYIRPFASHGTDKMLLCVQGKFLVATFTPDNTIDDISILGSDLHCRGAEIPSGTFHSVLALEPSSILYESHYGKPQRFTEAPWAPEHSDREGAKAFLQRIILANSREQVLSHLLNHGMMERYYDHKTPTRTAEEAAAALNVNVSQIAKSIVLSDDTAQCIIVVLPGDRRIDMGKVRQHFGHRFTMASPERTLAATGFLAGSVSPFALLGALPIYADISLKSHPEIFPAAGGINNGFRTSFHELTTLLGLHKCDFARDTQGA